MNDTIGLITEIFGSDNLMNEYSKLKEWLIQKLKTQDDGLLNDLQQNPKEESTQKRLKAFVAEIVSQQSVRKDLAEKLISLNKTRNQSIVNEQAVEKQINIAHHSGNIIVNNYGTQQEKKEEKETKLFDIQMLIASGDTKKAIEKLLQLAKLCGNDKVLNNVILLAGQFNRNERDITDAIISREDFRVTLVRLNTAALTYLDDLKNLNCQ
jgi:hypothetical protein